MGFRDNLIAGIRGFCHKFHVFPMKSFPYASEKNNPWSQVEARVKASAQLLVLLDNHVSDGLPRVFQRLLNIFELYSTAMLDKHQQKRHLN